MRAILAFTAIALLSMPAFAADRIECSQIPHAQSFLEGLKPGPNTSAAQRHLAAAKKARSDKQCVAELRKVDYYARRSAAADKRGVSAAPRRDRQARCADALHQNRPGGSDYRGPPARSCKRAI